MFTLLRRNKRGDDVIVSKRRDEQFSGSTAGVKQFTSKANAKAKSANRAKNKQARTSRKRNR